MLLVTGAAGKTGLAILAALKRQSIPVRALVRIQEQLPAVQAAGAEEIVLGDMSTPSVWHRAMRQVEIVYHICPNMHAQEFEIGKAAADAAVTAGVQHFVYHSVLHPQTEKMAHHWAKMRVEEYLFEQPLKISILQPTAYMQNLLSNLAKVKELGTYQVPYPVSSRLSLVDLMDVADAAVRILSDNALSGGTYELCGTEPLTQSAVADSLSLAIGRDVTAVEISQDSWQKAIGPANLTDYAATNLLRMFSYYASYGLTGSPFVLRQILGRRPTSLDAFLKRHLPNHGSGDIDER